MAAWVWQALVASCQRTYSRIGVVGRTDRMRLSVSVKGGRQAFFAIDASVLRVGSASALSKIPLLLWLKALDALYNFPAAGKVVGGKPGAR